jgi:hypothetical protein
MSQKIAAARGDEESQTKHSIERIEPRTEKIYSRSNDWMW